jgi:hypothetical protein
MNYDILKIFDAMAKVFMVLAKLCFSATAWGCRLAWSRLVDLGSIDSGSNPGSPTNLVLKSIRILSGLF